MSQNAATEAPHLLVVDDHPEIRHSLTRYLRDNGFRVSAADGGAQMRLVLQDASIDLVILDVMMPGEDGLSLCRDLTASNGPPVILLTALSDDTDQIVGLELGADDYVTKPFNPRELLARIRAVLRRTQGAQPQRQVPGQDRLHFSGWCLDLARRELTDPEGVDVALSNNEFLLLAAFLARAGRVLSRDQLLDLTQGREAGAYDRAIDNQVLRLRRKIEPDPANPSLIKTVWGGGYVFTANVSRDPA
ncbi:response regulator [Pseudomarimonas arenosa]|uniref:Response regulator n=1 Tax=Pseudomarimonas arenosa TaxID=2774145 RepID=A0AAW3ZSN7_9GAMM|nr:response regulator [Pseudomarimonas arenosa]MBD8527875.1 response regulator [Pseudomarimonas arenosa]